MMTDAAPRATAHAPRVLCLLSLKCEAGRVLNSVLSLAAIGVLLGLSAEAQTIPTAAQAPQAPPVGKTLYFELVEADGIVSATAAASKGKLVVTQTAGGNQTLFRRVSRYDTADKAYVGYLSPELNLILRFPRAGTGPMQMADLNAASPRYTQTTRTVRPLNPPAPRQPTPTPAPMTSPSPQTGMPLASGGGSGLPPLPSNPFAKKPIAGPYPNEVRPVVPRKTRQPLGPAMVTMGNGGPRAIQVQLNDLIEPRNSQSFRLDPGGSVNLTLTRDESRVGTQTVREMTLFGDVIERQVETLIASPVRYAVVVHEWQMQSVAIDRTPGGNNAIEDVNFSGAGLGQFQLPPGDQLESGVIDVYRTAMSQGNSSTVAPILAQEKAAATPFSPLERAVIEASQNRP